VGREFTLRIAVALIVVLLGLDRLAAYLGTRSARDGRQEPVVLVDNGEPLHDRMGKARVTPEDILAQARRSHGLESLDQIEYAVLGTSGGIAIVPRDQPSA
jgi:uncharacterized membrane protein YcaP (DUF421 family)